MTRQADIDVLFTTFVSCCADWPVHFLSCGGPLFFFVFLFLIGTDQSANRWPPTVAIPRQSDRPSSSLIRFHLQQQQQQQDPLSRHLLGSLASFLLPVSLNLSEYIFFSRVSTWKKKKMFGYLVVGELYSMAWPPACLLFIFFWKDATWLTDDTRSNLFGIFFFSHSWIISFHILKKKRKTLEQDVDLFWANQQVAHNRPDVCKLTMKLEWACLFS